jgi:hypothetical protein
MRFMGSMRETAGAALFANDRFDTLRAAARIGHAAPARCARYLVFMACM